MVRSKSTRRQLLRAAGAGGLGAALTACAHEHDPFKPNKPPVPGSAGWTYGEERWVTTSCGQCSAGCGLRVRVVEGRAVKVEGNPMSPVNRGGVGPRGLSSTQVLYDPDRFAQPMVRKARGGALEPVSWEEAMELLATRLGDLREAGRGHEVGILCGRERGLMYEAWQRFAQGYGTPNFVDTRGVEDGPTLTAMRAMQGVDDLPAYDWANARFILSLGSGVLDTSCQLLNFARARGQRRSGGDRPRIVHVGPALSRTAMNADEWIQAEPGTSAAFALGMAHVLVRDELHDADFVREHAQGFEDWSDADGEHKGFRSIVMEYTPEKAGAICGVEPRVIEDLARLAAESNAAFALTGRDDLRCSNGVHTAMAVHALNALLGAIDRPGGLLIQRAPPLAEWPEFEPDDVAAEALERPPVACARGMEGDVIETPLDLLPAALLAGAASPIDTLLIDSTNPVYSRADAARWRQALARVPFVVSFSPFADETTEECADLVLPDDTWLERWEDSCSQPNIGRAVFGLRQPVVERLLETRHTGDVLIELAATMGEEVAAALPFKDFQDAVKKRVFGLFKAKSGSIVEAKGGDFLKRIYEEGSWDGEPYEFEQWERVLTTESGRFEFCPTSLRSAVTHRDGAAAAKGAELDRLCSPDYLPLATCGDPQRFPLLLLPYKPHTYAKGSGANLPWLTELAPWKGRRTWATEAELHPSTAATLGVGAGDLVVIESEAGSIEARAYPTAGVREGVVRIALGAGHTAMGRYARDWGSNVMKLVSTECMDPLGGGAALQGTRVNVRRSEA